MAMATSLSTLGQSPSFTMQSSRCIGLVPVIQFRISVPIAPQKGNYCHPDWQTSKLSKRLAVRAATEGSAESSQQEEKIPSWAKLDSEDPPPWARGEGSGGSSESTFQIPFYAYLLASAISSDWFIF